MVNNSRETVVSGNNSSKLVSKIVKQISHRRISISLCQLMKIVKPEIRSRNYKLDSKSRYFSTPAHSM